MDPITILLILLGIVSGFFAIVFFMDVVKHKDEKVLGEEGQEIKGNFAISGVIGAVTAFFDTLGIGAFAPTTALFKATKVVDSGIFPGTLNVAHTLPAVLVSFLYINYVEVEVVTLFSLIGASIIGAWLGSGIVAKMNKRAIQGVMGLALIIVATMMLGRRIGVIRFLSEGTLGLSGANLIIGIVGFFILGALMTAGVGLYSPAMALVFLLGLEEPAAFPIMMGSCAFLMSVAGVRFVKEGKYARKQSLAITLLGLPGAWLAFTFFRGVFDLGLLIWLVMIVVALTGMMMLMNYFKMKD